MFLDFSTLVSAGLTFFALDVLFMDTVLLRDFASFAAAPLFLVLASDFAFPLPADFLAAF